MAYLDLELTPVSKGGAREKVVVVVIRQETFERLGTNPIGGTLPRRFQARLLRALRKAGAKDVLYDLFFSDPTSDDAEFREAIVEASRPPIVIPIEPVGDSRYDNDGTEFRVRRPAVLPLLRPSHVALGSPLAWDPDGVIRGVRLFVEDRDVTGTIYPHLSLAALGQIRHLDLDVSRPGWLSVGDRRWALGPAYGAPIRWSPLASEIEFSRAIDLAVRNQEVFKDAVVVIGATNQGQRLNDVHPTSVGNMSGAQFSAQAYLSMAMPASAQPAIAGETAHIWIELALSCLAFGLLARPSPKRVVLGLVAPLVLAAGFAYSMEQVYSIAFGLLRLSLAPLFTSVTFLATYAASQLPIWAKLGWENRDEEVCAMFVDLRSSTESLSKVSEPAKFLAEAQTVIARVVDASGGYIERTMGDGSFAVFRMGSRSQRASCAYLCLRRLKAEATRLAPTFEARFGSPMMLAIGAEMARVHGTVLRSKGRQEFTSLGRDIAFAQRLETASRRFDSAAAIGPRMHSLLDAPDSDFRAHEILLKGFDERGPSSVMEVLQVGLAD